MFDAISLSSVRGRVRISVSSLESRIAPAAWIPQGPSPSLNGQTENIPDSNPVSGAIHVVQAHPTNADIVYIGSVNGGIWKTTNATSASPTWTNLTDSQASQSIGAIEFDPTDPTFNTIYAGFGNFSSYGFIGQNRAGLIKSTDGGTTWTPVAGMAGRNISGIAARGNTIVVAVNIADDYTYPNVGLFRSTNGGASFVQITGASGTGIPGGVCYDLATDPTNNAVLYTSIIFAFGLSNGIYKSTNTGATWTKVSNATVDATFNDSTTSNVEISVGTSNNVYAGVINNGQISGLFRSGDGGANWSAMDIPKTPLGTATTVTAATNTAPITITSNGHGLSNGNLVVVSGALGNTAANGTWYVTVVDSNNFRLNGSVGNGAYVANSATWQRVSGLNPREKPEFAGGQGNIHFSILADPTDANIVYIGGDRQETPFPNSIGANDFSGRLFRGNASIAANPSAVPSPQWTPLTHSGTSNNSSPHADSRDLDFDANGNLIEGDDGGIFKRINPKLTSGSWVSLSGTGLQVMELHNIAYDNISNILIGGAQDNGTPQQQTTNGVTWRSVSTGDGGDVAVDDVTLASTGRSIRYSSFQNLAGFRRQVFNVNNGLVSSTGIALPGGFVANFTTPVELNAVTPTRLIIGGQNAVYESSNQGDSWTQLSGGGLTGFLSTPMVYGHADNPDTIWIANGAAVLRRTTIFGTGLTATTAAFPGGAISDIVLGANSNTAYVLDSTRLFRTTNGGTSWANITGNLFTAAGSTTLRSIEYIPAPTGDILVVGTGKGTFSALAANPTVWAPYGTGLPTVPVWDLDYDPVDDVLAIGTLGRGAWIFRDASMSERDLIIHANRVGGNGKNNSTADNFRLITNGPNLEIYIQGTLSRSVPIAGINSILVEGSSDNDTLEISSDLLNLVGGTTFSGLGGINTLDGPALNTTWNITGLNAGVMSTPSGSMSFTSVQNLAGDSATDTFGFGSSGQLDGTLAGGSGADQVLGSASAESFQLIGPGAGQIAVSLVNGFSGIESVSGGGGLDELTSDSNPRTITISSGTSGTISGLLSFSDFFTVTGNSSNDTLITDDVPRNITLFSPNTVNIGSITTFAGTENIIGGSADDTLVVFQGGSLTGKFDGRGGQDTLNLSARTDGQTVTAKSFTANGFTLLLSGLTSAYGVDAIIGADSGSDRLIGLPLPSEWRARSGANQSYYRLPRTGNTLTLSGFNRFSGAGSSDAMTLDFSAGNPITNGLIVDGGAGVDSLEIIGTNMTDAIRLLSGSLSVNGQLVSYINSEQFTVRAGDGADVITVGSLLPSIVSLVNIFGEGGNDYAQVLPSATARIVYDGGVGTDRLRVDVRQSGLPYSPPPPSATSGSLRFLTRKSIDFLSIESRDFGIVVA